jgi:drug/metabolite transporter (DMT)-like permease
MTWVSLALAAYFFLAVVELIDKKILSTPRLSPLTYAFYNGLLTSAVFILWPFDFSFLSPSLTVFALLGGITFFGAIYFLYSAIIKGEISRVISIVGGFSPIIIFILSLLFLEEKFHTYSLAALFMLVAGSIVLSFVKDGGRFVFGKHFFLSSFLAAVFFALSYFFTKVVFLEASFLNGFVWIRIGTLICVLAVFLKPSWRGFIIEGSRGVSKNLTALFLFNKGISALAHVILNYAVKLGSVAIVSALQAVLYVFLFVMALGLSYFRPHLFYESYAFKTLALKIIGIGLVSFGVVLLFLGP